MQSLTCPRGNLIGQTIAILCYVTAFRRRENAEVLISRKKATLEIGRTRPVVFIGDEKKKKAKIQEIK